MRTLIAQHGCAAVLRFFMASRLASATRICLCGVLLLMAACQDLRWQEAASGPREVRKVLNPAVGGTIELFDGPTLTFPPGALPPGDLIMIWIRASDLDPPPRAAAQ